MFLVNRTCPVLTFRATDAHNERERASASVGGAQWCARVVTDACASSFCVCHVFGLGDKRVLTCASPSCVCARMVGFILRLPCFVCDVQWDRGVLAFAYAP